MTDPVQQNMLRHGPETPRSHYFAIYLANRPRVVAR